jgi:hypothetical protein
MSKKTKLGILLILVFLAHFVIASKLSCTIKLFPFVSLYSSQNIEEGMRGIFGGLAPTCYWENIIINCTPVGRFGLVKYPGSCNNLCLGRLERPGCEANYPF